MTVSPATKRLGVNDGTLEMLELFSAARAANGSFAALKVRWPGQIALMEACRLWTDREVRQPAGYCELASLAGR